MNQTKVFFYYCYHHYNYHYNIIIHLTHLLYNNYQLNLHRQLRHITKHLDHNSMLKFIHYMHYYQHFQHLKHNMKHRMHFEQLNQPMKRSNLLMCLYCLESIGYPKALVMLMLLHLKLIKQDLKGLKINLKLMQKHLVQLQQQLMRLYLSNLKSRFYYQCLTESKKLYFNFCRIIKKVKYLNSINLRDLLEQ